MKRFFRNTDWTLATILCVGLMAGVFASYALLTVRDANAAGAHGIFLKTSVTGTAETDTVTFHAYTRGSTCFIFPPQNGTIKTYYINPDGIRRQLDSRTVVAATLKTIDLDLRLPHGIVTYTADVDPTGSNIEVECSTY